MLEQNLLVSEAPIVTTDIHLWTGPAILKSHLPVSYVTCNEMVMIKSVEATAVILALTLIYIVASSDVIW